MHWVNESIKKPAVAGFFMENPALIMGATALATANY